VQDRSRQRGQAIALLALALATIVAGVAVVVDGGYAFAQRRASQNAADFGAMAGTRVIGLHRTGNPASGAQVSAAIDVALAANDASLVEATYINEDGLDLGPVSGAGSIPQTAFGVVVEAKTSWKPFLLGVLGITDWEAGSIATAETPGHVLGGGVMPVGLEDTRFNNLRDCPLTSLDPCIDQNLTSGSLNIPGGFGWLKFGLEGNGGKCDWGWSLGMVADGGCQSSKPFLDSQIGPPADSHGCCTAVDQPGPNGEVNENKIGSLTGNEWGDLSFYIDNRIPVWVPIFDPEESDEQGANGFYKIVGFGAIVFTGDNEHAKWLQGAAIEDACAEGTEIPGSDYCTAPGGPFILDATGEVTLIN
jgi:hypothetical protein